MAQRQAFSLRDGHRPRNGCAVSPDRHTSHTRLKCRHRRRVRAGRVGIQVPPSVRNGAGGDHADVNAPPGQHPSCLIQAGLKFTHARMRPQALKTGGPMMRDRLRRSLLRRLGAMMVVAALTGCAVYAEPYPVYQPAPARTAPVEIPPGHLPPPGECRIWFPDRPPGHQPPPGPCRVLRHRVPPGAYLIYG